VLDVERMLVTEPPPVPWVVEPLLAEACVTMLAGREGQGKSMLAMALAAAIGHGASIAGLDCREGRVLYVDAENGEREAHRRVHGLGVKPGQLVYVEAVGFNLAKDVGLIADLVAQHEPTVVVLDSLRSLAPGLDENDSRPVEAALRPVSRLAQNKGIPVVLLHHAGKLGLEYRGSTAIGAAVEIGFTLSRHSDDRTSARAAGL
jgi:RecA-family ATPase